MASSDDKTNMRVLRVCLLLLLAAIIQPSLQAATRYSPRRFVGNPVALHRTSAGILHRIAFQHHYPRILDLPAEPVQSSVNPPSPSHGFSLISFALHSFLGLFRRTVA